MREAWFALPGRPWTCKSGHVIPQDWQLCEDGFPRCPRCRARVYALLLPRRGSRPLVLLVDVTEPEKRALLERAATVEEILEALGLVHGMPTPFRDPRPVSVAPRERAS